MLCLGQVPQDHPDTTESTHPVILDRDLTHQRGDTTNNTHPVIIDRDQGKPEQVPHQVVIYFVCCPIVLSGTHIHLICMKPN